MPNGTNNKNVRQVRHRQGGGDSLPSQTKEEHIKEIENWDLRRSYDDYRRKLERLRDKVEGTEGEAWEEWALENIAPWWWDDYNSGPFDPDLSFHEWRRALKGIEKRREFEREFGPPWQHAITGKPIEINKGGVIPRKPRKPRKVSKVRKGGAIKRKPSTVSKVRKGGAIKRTSRKTSTVRKGGVIKRKKKK